MLTAVCSSVLQESLEMHRPEFISRSRQRVKCLALHAEERRLQADLIREGNLFNQAGRFTRSPRPAGLQKYHPFNRLLLLFLSTRPLLAEVGPVQLLIFVSL